MLKEHIVNDCKNIQNEEILIKVINKVGKNGKKW